MATPQKYMEYSIKYAKEHFKRVPLDLRLEVYEQVKNHAEERGESINGFIKRSIQETIERDNKDR